MPPRAPCSRPANADGAGGAGIDRPRLFEGCLGPLNYTNLPHNCLLTVILGVHDCCMTPDKRRKTMSSLDLDFDTQMNNLEREWREVYDDSIVARGRRTFDVANGLRH